MIKFYNLEFKNKTKLKDYIFEYINNVGFGAFYEGETFDFLLNVLKLHPEYKKKAKKGIKGFRIKKNINGVMCLIIRPDDSVIDFSILVCCGLKKLATPHDNLMGAMRWCIKPQISEFRNTSNYCNNCGSYANLEVHHIIPFKLIVDKFISKWDVLPVKFDDGQYNNAIFRPKHKIFENEWFAYHLKHAKYSLLCRGCHRVETVKFLNYLNFTKK